MSAQTLYQQKRMSAADAIGVVMNGDTIVVPTAVGEPPALLTALSEARHSYRNVRISQILPVRKYGYFDPETTEHVRHIAYFFSGISRAGGQEGWTDFIPANFSELPELLTRKLIPADVVFSMASPMDEHGFFSLSLAPDYTMAAIGQARAVVLEVNPHVPFANGNCHIHVSQVAALTESEEPLLEVGLPKIGPVQEAIGRYVADMIPDGATLQIGYGGIPDAVVMQLTDKHDLGIHTEMIGDGIMSLVEAGVVTNRKKNYHNGKMLATFALGSRKLYQFLHRNPAVEMHPVGFTNDPTWPARTTTCTPSTRPCRSTSWASAARRAWARRRIPAPAARPTLCAPPTAPVAARPSSCCPRPPSTTPSRASCPACPPARTSPPARTTSTTW